MLDTVTQPQEATQPKELARTEKQISLYYGERSEIRELVDRMRAGLPNAANIPDAGIRALATAAYAHDLDPWNGEIWVIYNEKKNETSLMAGVKGLRKAAKKQLENRHHYYLSFRPILQEEYPQYGLDKADEYGHKVELAEICELRRGDACEEYSKTLRQVFDMCGSFDVARDMLGPMPVYIGVGVVREGTRSKMEKCQLVKKRAESDALKRAFDLPFSDRVSGNGDSVTVGNADEDDGAIEGEYEAWDVRPEGTRAPDDGSPLASTDEQPERPMIPEVLRDYVRSRGGPAGPGYEGITDKQLKVAGGLLKGLFKGSATQGLDAGAYLAYVAGPYKVEDISKKTASVLIDLVKAEGDDEWGVSEVARLEAERVLREVNVDQGQLDMFDEEQDSDEQSAETEPTPDPEPEPPTAEKPVVSAQAAPAPVTSGRIPINPAPKAAAKPKAKPEPKNVEEKPPEPIKDNGEDINILALKRCKPSSWVTAAEMLNKELKTSFTAGSIREAAAKKMDKKQFETLSPADGWLTAVDVAQEASPKK